MCVCISVRFLDATHPYSGTRKPFYSTLTYSIIYFRLGGFWDPGLMLPEFYQRLYNYSIFGVHGIRASVSGNVSTKFGYDTSK